MDKVLINVDTLNKILSVLTQLTYAQYPKMETLMEEIKDNVEQVNGIDSVPAADVSPSANDSDGGDNSIHLKDQE